MGGANIWARGKKVQRQKEESESAQKGIFNMKQKLGLQVYNMAKNRQKNRWENGEKILLESVMLY